MTPTVAYQIQQLQIQIFTNILLIAQVFTRFCNCLFRQKQYVSNFLKTSEMICRYGIGSWIR